MPEEWMVKKLTLAGFKSIDSDGQTIALGNITVFLGANGAGKSNLVAFFRLLNAMTTESLQQFVGKRGFAESLLHFGSKNTTRIRAELEFSADSIKEVYAFTLGRAAGDTLIFMDEEIRGLGRDGERGGIDLGKGRKETGLRENVEKESGEPGRIVSEALRRCRVYQFHDTSDAAKIRGQVYIGDNERLRGEQRRVLLNSKGDLLNQIDYK